MSILDQEIDVSKIRHRAGLYYYLDKPYDSRLTYRDIVELSKAELLKQGNFGKASVRQLEALLQGQGLYFGYIDPPVKVKDPKDFTVIDDLEQLAELLKTKPEEERNEFAYMRMLRLCDTYRPSLLKAGDVNAALDAELLTMSTMGAVRHARAKLGVSLVEARDYVYRLKGLTATPTGWKD